MPPRPLSPQDAVEHPDLTAIKDPFSIEAVRQHQNAVDKIFWLGADAEYIEHIGRVRGLDDLKTALSRGLAYFKTDQHTYSA